MLGTHLQPYSALLKQYKQHHDDLLSRRMRDGRIPIYCYGVLASPLTYVIMPLSDGTSELCGATLSLRAESIQAIRRNHNSWTCMITYAMPFCRSPQRQRRVL